MTSRETNDEPGNNRSRETNDEPGNNRRRETNAETGNKRRSLAITGDRETNDGIGE